MLHYTLPNIHIGTLSWCRYYDPRQFIKGYSLRKQLAQNILCLILGKFDIEFSISPYLWIKRSVFQSLIPNKGERQDSLAYFPAVTSSIEGSIHGVDNSGTKQIPIFAWCIQQADSTFTANVQYNFAKQ